MTNCEYIFRQAKKFHYTKWDEEELRKCVDMLPSLSREELFSLYRSKWSADAKVLREAIFKTLFKEQIGKREQRIKDLDTDALILEFQDKRSGLVELIRKEMQERYKANKDRNKIASAFNASTKGDQQWVKSQIRKELYSDKLGKLHKE